MDVGKAFTFFQEDPKWVTKLLIGGGIVLAGTLLGITLIGGLLAFAILYGYAIRLTRNVAEGRSQPLPEWDDWGGLLRDGFKCLAVYFTIALPVVLLGIALLLPGSVLMASSDSGVAAAGAAVYLGGFCLVLPLSLLSGLVIPAPLGRLAVTGSVRQALRPGPTFASLRAHFVPYLIVFALTAFVTSTIAYLGMAACFVGFFFTVFYASLVNHHLYGQVYRQTHGAGSAYGKPAYPQSFPS